MNRVRLFLAGGLIFVASRIAPRSMRFVFLAYGRMLNGFSNEPSNRTYGVVVTPWGLGKDDLFFADELAAAAVEAASDQRAILEKMEQME